MIAEKVKYLKEVMVGKKEPEYVALPEYKNFIDRYRAYLKALSALRAIRMDIKYVRAEYGKVKGEYTAHLKTSEPVDPMLLQSKLSEFNRQIRELQKTESEAEQLFYSEEKKFRDAWHKFAEVYDRSFIWPLLKKRNSILNELKKTECDLQDALTAWNDRSRIVLEDSDIPRIGISKETIEIIDTKGYDAWKDATQNK